MNNVEVVRKVYEDFGHGNMPEVLDAFDANIEWMGARGLPFHAGDGVVVGPQNILQDVFVRVPEYFEVLNMEIQDIFGVEDKVVVQSYFTGTWKSTGKSFKANSVNIWHLQGGKIVRMFESLDTSEIMN